MSTIGAKMKAALLMMTPSGRAVAKQAAEQEEIKVRLLKDHGPELGQILWESAVKVSQEQGMTLKDAAAFVEERKVVMDQFAERVQEAWKVISTTVQKAWSQIKDLISQAEDLETRERHKWITRISHQKKKSQARNWSKWKKRKR